MLEVVCLERVELRDELFGLVLGHAGKEFSVGRLKDGGVDAEEVSIDVVCFKWWVLIEWKLQVCNVDHRRAAHAPHHWEALTLGFGACLARSGTKAPH